MALNLSLPETFQTDSRTAFIAGMQNRLQRDKMKEERELREAERKQKELDEATERLHRQEAIGYASTFPMDDIPAPATEAGTPTGESKAETLPERQNRWLGEMGPKLLQYKNGPAMLQHFRDLRDASMALQKESGERFMAIEEAKRQANIRLKYGDSPDGPMLYNKDRSLDFIMDDLDKSKLQYGELPPDLFGPDGNLDRVKYFNFKSRLQREQKKDDPEKQSTGMIAAREILAAQDDLDDARKSGDPAAIARAEQGLQLLKDAFPTRNTEEIEMGMDDQGRPIFKLTRGGRSTGTGAGPTVATESEAQKRVMAASRTMADIAALDELRPEDVGIRGAIGEKFIDRLAAQFAPEMENDKRTENRTRLKNTIEGMVRQITNDNRFSIPDKRDAKDAIASAGWNDSLPRIKKVFQTLVPILTKRAIMDAKAARIPFEPWMGKNLQAKDILEMNRAGLITADEALQLFGDEASRP